MWGREEMRGSGSTSKENGLWWWWWCNHNNSWCVYGQMGKSVHDVMDAWNLFMTNHWKLNFLPLHKMQTVTFFTNTLPSRSLFLKSFSKLSSSFLVCRLRWGTKWWLFNGPKVWCQINWHVPHFSCFSFHRHYGGGKGNINLSKLFAHFEKTHHLLIYFAPNAPGFHFCGL